MGRGIIIIITITDFNFDVMTAKISLTFKVYLGG